MSTTVAPALRLASTLPLAPSTTAMLAAVSARLDALTYRVLPAIHAERVFLADLWHSDAPHARILHVSDGDDGCILACDPIGADRLATVLAAEDALVREQTALRELKLALEDYQDGGRSMRTRLDDPHQVPDDATSVPVAADVEPSVRSEARENDTASTTGRARTRQLRAYLATIDRDLVRATAAGQTDEVAAYTLERDVVRDRLGRWLTQTAAWIADRAEQQVPIGGRKRDGAATTACRGRRVAR